MGKEYCYKVKHGLIKVKENNAYAKPKIEAYGFKPVQEVFTNESGEETYCWAGCWAKPIKLDKSSIVAKWLKKNIEDIYKKEKDKNSDSKWLKEILESGYEFDADGNLIENQKFLDGLEGQLCINADGEYRGVLYINMSGCVEFFDAKTLISSAFEDVMKLINADVIYKKRLKAED